MREEILGLHSDWCANLTVLAWVCTECVKVAISAGCEHVLLPNGIRAKGGRGARAKQGLACGRDSPGAVHGPPWYTFCVIATGVMGNVHRSVLGSLEPIMIMFLLYITYHTMFEKTTIHLAFHRMQIPSSDATCRSRTMCPSSTVGRPGITMSQTWADLTTLPSGKLIVRGCVAG
jgi:hypothetical protein